MDGRGNNMILHNANMFIVEADISRYLNGPSDQTGSHEMQERSIIHLKPFNGNSFPLVSPDYNYIILLYNIIINIHVYANEIKFSNRSITSIYLSHDTLLVQQQCHNDGLGLKIVYLWILNHF